MLEREGEVVFCESCGYRLDRVAERVVGYDGQTGRRFREARYRCPRKRWLDSHTDVWTEVVPALADIPADE